jgi:hypothetical protein
MLAPLLLCLAAPAAAAPDDPPIRLTKPPVPLVAKYLAAGDLNGADAALRERLAAEPDDDDARFSLGMVTFLNGIEDFATFMAAHGSADRLFGAVPFARIPVPENPEPRPVTYEQWRQARIELLAAFDAADAILAKVDGPVDVRLDLATFQIDLNGDAEGGKLGVAGLMNGGRTRMGAGARRAEGEAESTLPVHFDRADVEWLRGYCDLLGALLEVMLAHDAEEWWNHCAHLIFAKPEGVDPYLLHRDDNGRWDDGRIADVIAAIHHLDLPVREPERMANARRRLLGMIGHSRAMWEHILAETDEGPEWVPGPGQTSVTGAEMSRERVEGWLDFLSEAGALLNGDKLAPFWRTFPEEGAAQATGVNVRRVFEEPRRFDLIDWVQGPGAEPYLERGDVTDADTWRRFQRLFNGNFIGFAAWIN